MIDRIKYLHNIYGLNEDSFYVPRPSVLRHAVTVSGFQWQLGQCKAR